jgi:hydrogenase maturation factor
MPCGPLADDWLFWDAETIFAYPHSREHCPPAASCGEVLDQVSEPLQLELFQMHIGSDGPASSP